MGMRSPPSSTSAAEVPFDHSNPFRGVVVCCTSIPPDQRTEIADRTHDLGGVHKYDLTPDVTHLIVGEYDTPKYRHVARERPDVKAMAAGWIDAVRDLWMADQEIDFAKLEAENQLKPFETSGGLPSSTVPEEKDRRRLLVCLTGFEDQERQYIEETVKANGGEYIGDLSRKVTHLIVYKPEGKKYQAAKNWNIITVSLEWLNDSVHRGMILEETCYDPILPKEERGKGAIINKKPKRQSIGKRSRDGTPALLEDGRRKLRKTASMRLSSQGNSLWGDILGNKLSVDSLEPRLDPQPAVKAVSLPPAAAVEVKELESTTQHEDQTQPSEGVFADCRFFIHGFPERRIRVVCEHLTSHGGKISPSLADVSSNDHPEPSDQRFLVVPQSSQPDTHPLLPEGVHIVTEFYLERCLHGKQLFHPNEHVLGRPFPQFPIEGFADLIICTAGFKNEQLNQVEKTVVQLGAKYAERLNSQSSLLICPSVASVRKQKLDYALFTKIPIVGADWLWQCISAGFKIPTDNFMFPELKQRLGIDVDPDLAPDLTKQRQKLQRSRSEPGRNVKQNPEFRAPTKAGVDATAFEKDSPAVAPEEQRTNRKPNPEESVYDTAPTHQDEGSLDVGPLRELAQTSLNKSPSPPKLDQPPRKQFRRFPTGGTIGDSEAGDDSDAAISVIAVQDSTASQTELAERRKATDDRVAAERQAMASRLSNLIEDGNAILPHGAPSSRPQRRKREILGRAVSVASAASSASADSSSNAAAAAAAAVAGRRIESVSSILGEMLETEGGSLSKENEETPSATQIGYDDPDARRRRAAVLDKMSGGRNAGAEKQRSQEKVTMETLRNDDLTGTAASRRSRRR
ncbi:hypothetical protein BX600DRAFT_81073 [Xylariales sp. PMI_506]|nr:hypothetical protein BX600DRAFT_81073 [Xylariales sp. PMI_506]